MNDCTFLSNYFQFCWSYAILSDTTYRIFDISLEANDFTVDVTSIQYMFVDIIKSTDLGWLATNNDQQSYQRLSQTSERVRFGRWWTFWAYWYYV